MAKEENKDLKLTIKERLIIQSLYPERSDIIVQKVIQGISQKVNLGLDEIKEINLRTNPAGGYLWDETKAKPKKITFTPIEIRTLKDQIDLLDKQKNILLDMIPVIEKIKDL